jgi:hypothetical protein
MTFLQIPTLGALTRRGDTMGGISRTLNARDVLDLLALCGPSPSDYMRVVSGTGRGALAIFFALHE